MAVIGCDYPSGPIVGAESMIGQTGVWIRTHFQQKGPYLHATTYMVAAGRPKVFEMRIDLRPIERALQKVHQRWHAEGKIPARLAAVSGDPLVGWGLGSMWKSAKKMAKKIGRSKLLKSVGRVTKSVVKATKGVIKSKITGALGAVLTIFPPTAALGAGVTAAYVAANAAVKALENGKKVVDGAMEAKRTIERGVKAAKTIKGALSGGRGRAAASASARLRLSAKGRAVMAKASPAKKAALAAALKKRFAARSGLTRKKPQLSAKGRAALARAKGPKRAALARALKRRMAQKAQAAARARAAATARRAAPSHTASARGAMSAQSYARHMADAKRAAALKKRLKSPAVRKKLMTVKKRSENARAALEGIAQRAKFGSGQEKLDAQKSAAIVNLVAKNRARVRAAAQIHAGGLPALLIDKRGRIKPGRFRAMAIPAGMSPDVLYLGPGKPSDSGHFARVSGSPVGSPLIGCGNMPCARCRG